MNKAQKVLIVLLLFFIIWQAYKSYEKKEKPAKGPEIIADPRLMAISEGARKYATKKMCQKYNMIYDPDTDTCVNTEQSCKSFAAFMNDNRSPAPIIKRKGLEVPIQQLQADVKICQEQVGNDKDKMNECMKNAGYNDTTAVDTGSLAADKYPYTFEWHPEANRCVRVLKNIPEICTQLSRTFVDPNAVDDRDMRYQQGMLVCDKDGNCDENMYSLPTCLLTADYCKSKGLDVAVGADGRVDCELNEGQNIAENLVGSYFVRKFRKGLAGDPKSFWDLTWFSKVPSVFEKAWDWVKHIV
jgi:hypothetical protein